MENVNFKEVELFDEGNGLIKVYLTDKGEFVVDGRELWQGLQSKRQFGNWIQKRLEECDAIENEDYFSFNKIVKRETGGTTVKEYIIKLDIAKEMAMMERNDIGKQYRRYLINTENKYREMFNQKMSSEMNWLVKDFEEIATRVCMGILDTMFKSGVFNQSSTSSSTSSISDDLLTVTEIAKEYGNSARWLNDTLATLGVQVKEDGKWQIVEEYANKGYTKTVYGKSRDGARYFHMYWTAKGKDFINELLASKINIHPKKRMVPIDQTNKELAKIYKMV